MPTPRVFVGSTCYDLKYIRENLRYFIKTLGYEPVLSDDGGVFYDPGMHTHDACLVEVPTCQIFVLVIGGRSGGKFHDSSKSITNREYEAAVGAKVPVFALVEQAVFAEHHVWLRNRSNSDVAASAIVYPAVDNVAVFEFIEQVRRADQNNALVPFRDYADIEAYLRKQWAGMLFTFLTQRSEGRRIADTLAELSAMNQKLEAVTRALAHSVGDKHASATIAMYDELLKWPITQNLAAWGIRLSPRSMIVAAMLEDVVGDQVESDLDRDGFTLVHGGPPYRASALQFASMREDYANLRQRLLEMLRERTLNLEEYLAATAS